MTVSVKHVEDHFLAFTKGFFRIPNAVDAIKLFGLISLGLLGNHLNIEL
jgi:hypothetical protein